MFVDIRKLTRQQVKEVLEAAGWAWDDAKSIDGEQNRRDCEALVNEHTGAASRRALAQRLSWRLLLLRGMLTPNVGIQARPWPSPGMTC